MRHLSELDEWKEVCAFKDAEIERLRAERDEACDACWSAIPWFKELEHLGSLVDHKRRMQTLEHLRRAVGTRANEQRTSVEGE